MFWCLSRSVVLSTVGPLTCTVVDVRPSPAASSAVAPGVGRGACCVPPPGVPIVASWAYAPPSSAPALSSVFTILDGNRCCVDVSFPDGPPAAPGDQVSGPPSGRAFPPGHTSSPSSGSAPGPSSRFRLPLWNFGVFHHFCHNGHLSSVRQDRISTWERHRSLQAKSIIQRGSEGWQKLRTWRGLSTQRR